MLGQTEIKQLEEAMTRALSRGVYGEEALYILAHTVGLPIAERVAIFDRMPPIGVFSEAIH